MQGAGFLQIQRACSTCKGSGKQIPLACAKCAGQGRMRKNIEVQINVPKGVDNGRIYVWWAKVMQVSLVEGVVIYMSR